MDNQANPLWDLFERQKHKGLAEDMRRTLKKIETMGKVDARWHNALGELCLLERRYTDAAENFKHAIVKSPLPGYRLNLANARFWDGRYDDACQVLKEYLLEYPDDAHCLANLINCHLAQGDLTEARKTAERGLRSEGYRPLFHNALGQIECLEHHHEKALDQFDCAYKESPDYVDALYNRGNMHFRLGHLSEAEEDYRLCLRKDENHLQACLNLSSLHVALKNYPQALMHANQALGLAPASGAACHQLGSVHLAGGELRLARDAFRQALLVEPGHWPSLLALAKLHLDESAPQAALEWIEELRKSRRRIPSDAVGECIRLLFELHEFQQCLDWEADYKGKDSSTEWTLIHVACLWKTGKRAQAIALLEKNLHNSTGSPRSMTLLGMMLAQQGAEELAMSRLQKALEMDAGFKEAAMELAALHAKRNQFDQSIGILESYRRKRPDDPECFYNLACCHGLRKNPDEAFSFLRQAVEHGFHDWELMQTDPDLVELRNSRGIDALLQTAQLA